jgi:hypothetical protein
MLVRKRASIVIPILSLPFQKAHAMTCPRHRDEPDKCDHREDKSDQAASSEFLFVSATGTVPARAILRIDEFIAATIQPGTMKQDNFRLLVRHSSKSVEANRK